MKNTLLILLFTLFTLPLAAQNKGFEIKVKVKGVSNAMCYIGNYYGDKQFYKDSALADAKGQMVFKRNEPLPCGIYMVIIPGTRYFEFVMNDREQFFSMEADTIDFVKSMKVKGSAENEKFYEYLKYIAVRTDMIMEAQSDMRRHANQPDSLAIAREHLNKLDKEITDYRLAFIVQNPNNLLTKIFKAMKDPEVPEPPMNADGTKDSTFAFHYYKSHFFDGIDFSEDCLVRTPIFHKRLERYMLQLTLQIPDSIIASADYVIEKTRGSQELFKWSVWWISNHYERSPYMCMDKVFAHIGLKYYTYKDAWWADTATIERVRARAKVLAPLGCDQVAPNLVMRDTSGKYQSLHQVKARYTALIFWDPDCSHCRKEMPVIKAAYDKLKKNGFEVYAVTVEQEMDKWKNYIRENKLEWINVMDENNQRGVYDINSTPVIYLLDKDKKIMAKKLNAEQLQDILEREFGLKDKNAPVPAPAKDDHEHPHMD